MKTRVITAVICVLIFIPFLIFSDTWAFPVLLSLLSFAGVYEMLKCLGEKNIICKIAASLTALALPFCARLYNNEQNFFNFTHKVFIVLMFLLFVCAVFSKGKRDVSESAMVYLTTFYISIGFSSIVLLRDYEYGQYIYLLVFLCPWMTDIFAYFSGYFFGKHKLIPDVSPKKTVEGAIGGTVFCTLTFLMYGVVIGAVVPELTPNYPAFIIIGCVMSLIAQCGDLIFSLIKRKYGIKDYGTLLPGHGGIMDRFDSVIATAPFTLLLFDLSKIFNLFI